ncbi:MAG: hypothetical protein ACI308_09780 [Muribaculaceae bacterium]
MLELLSRNAAYRDAKIGNFLLKVKDCGEELLCVAVLASLPLVGYHLLLPSAEMALVAIGKVACSGSHVAWRLS